ncbi:MAG: glycosyltransferase [Planctomycetota bacterium]|nr:MAG: glycosyltransferase [Planctomycetota bacterium]
MADEVPFVTIAIPHWEVEELIRLCLRSIRLHWPEFPVEVLVVDNGSKDQSLEYLRSLSWIRLIERKDPGPGSWVDQFATALDLGVQEGRGKYFLALHSDVIILKSGWLDQLVQPLEKNSGIASSGMDKLEQPPLWYQWLRKIDFKKFRLWIKKNLGLEKNPPPKRYRCPRDFCALYRREVLEAFQMSFLPKVPITPGEWMHLQLLSQGFQTKMLPVPTMMEYLLHLGHGTAGIQREKRRLPKKSSQKKVERRLQRILQSDYVQELLSRHDLDD